MQMALYKYGLLNADGITPGILDQGTLQAVSAFQQKVNNIFGSGLYVIDPTTDAYIDNATIDYLLHREINFQDASE